MPQKISPFGGFKPGNHQKRTVPGSFAHNASCTDVSRKCSIALYPYFLERCPISVSVICQFYNHFTVVLSCSTYSISEYVDRSALNIAGERPAAPSRPSCWIPRVFLSFHRVGRFCDTSCVSCKRLGSCFSESRSVHDMVLPYCQVIHHITSRINQRSEKNHSRSVCFEDGQ